MTWGNPGEWMLAAGQAPPASGEGDRSVRVAVNVAVTAALQGNWEESASALQPVMEAAQRQHRYTNYTAWASGQLVLL